MEERRRVSHNHGESVPSVEIGGIAIFVGGEYNICNNNSKYQPRIRIINITHHFPCGGKREYWNVYWNVFKEPERVWGKSKLCAMFPSTTMEISQIPEHEEKDRVDIPRQNAVADCKRD